MANGKKNSGQNGKNAMEASEEFADDDMLNPSSKRHKDRFIRNTENTGTRTRENERTNEK